MSNYSEKPQSGPGASETAPVDPTTSPDTEPDTDEPPVEPSASADDPEDRPDGAARERASGTPQDD